MATSWLARSPVLPMSSESVRSPSIHARPRPYQMTYPRKICPLKRRFLKNAASARKPTRHQMLSYKNVGCTGAVGSTVMPADSVTCTDRR